MADATTDLIIRARQEMQDAVKGFESLKGKLKGVEKNLGTLEKKAKVSASKMTVAFKKAGDGLTKASNRIGGAFRGMLGQATALLGTAGIVGLFIKATRSASNFETELRKVSTLFKGDATKSMEKFRKGILDLSRETGESIETLTGGLFDIVSAGVKGSETVEGASRLLEVASKAAIGGFTDTGTAVDVLTTLLNSYKISTEEAATMSDKLVTIARLGKCVVGSTRVLLADGRYERIDKLKEGGTVVSYDGRSFVPMRAEWVDQGTKPTVRIRTRLGREIVTTWNHPYLTKVLTEKQQNMERCNPHTMRNQIAEWCKVSDLKVGDRIGIPTTLPYFGNVDVPDHVSGFLGLWLAEGSCRSTSPRITSTQYGEQIREWADRFICRVKNIEKREGKSPVWQISGGDRGVTKEGDNPVQGLLVEYGLNRCTSGTKHVPAEVFCWDRKSLAVFLRWIFNGDGWLIDTTVGNRSPQFQVGFVSKSERLVRDVAHLLLRFGVVGKVRKRDGIYNCWVWEINRYSEVSRFVKFIGIDRPANASVLSNVPPKQRTQLDIVEFDPIVSIDAKKDEHVYDLMVEEIHNFVANDIVTHNTTFGEMAPELGKVTAVAAAAGISMDELGGAIVELTKGGRRINFAMTDFRAIVTAVLKPTKDLKALFKAAGFESGEAALKARGFAGVMEMIGKASGGSAAQILKYIQQQEALAGSAILASADVSGLRKSIDEIGGSTGATEEAYAKMSETFEFKTRRFKALMEETFVKLGEAILPTVIETLEDLSKWVDDNNDEIVGFFKNVFTWFKGFADYVIKYGPTVATILGSIWLGGKLVAMATALKSIVSGMGKLAQFALGPAVVPAVATGISGGLVGGGAVGALLMAQEAQEEGRRLAEKFGKDWEEVSKTVGLALSGVATDQLDMIKQGTEGYRILEDAAIEAFKAARGGVSPDFAQLAKLRDVVKDMIQFTADEREKARREEFEKEWNEVGELEKKKVDAGTETRKVLTKAQIKARDAALKRIRALEIAAMDKIAQVRAAMEDRIAAIRANKLLGFGLKEKEIVLLRTAAEERIDDIREAAQKKIHDAEMKPALARAALFKKVDEVTAKAAAEYHKIRLAAEETAKKIRENHLLWVWAQEDKIQQMRLRVMDRLIAGDVGGAVGSAISDSLSDALSEELGREWGETLGDAMGEELGDALTTVMTTIADIGMTIFEKTWGMFYQKALDQVMELIDLGLELAGEGVTPGEPGEGGAADRLTETLDKMVAWWENVVAALPGILDWLTNTALPKLFDAIMESLPKIMDTLNEMLPKLMDKIIEYFPRFFEMANQGFRDMLPVLVDMVLDLVIALIDELPGIIKAIVDGILAALAKLVSRIPELIRSIISFVGELVGIILELIVEGIPELVAEIIKMLPEIIKALIVGIFKDFIPMLVKAIGDALKGLFSGKSPLLPWNWFHEGGMVGSRYHDGGMIGGKQFADNVAMFGAAVRAHNGLFVSPGLAADEVPIIAQAGEAVLSRAGVAAAGGETGIDALNAGVSPGAGAPTTINNIVNTDYLFGEEAADVIDRLQGENLLRGTGDVADAINRGKVSGFGAKA